MNFGRFLRGLTDQGSVVGALEKDVVVQVGKDLVEPAEIRDLNGQIIITLRRPVTPVQPVSLVGEHGELAPADDRRKGARARRTPESYRKP